MGEEIEIFPDFTSASKSPTICQVFLWSVSSSMRTTVAPNYTVSPASFDTSMISARENLSSNSRICPSIQAWRSFAA